MALYCGNCGARLRDGAKFCENCGAAVQTPAQDTPFVAADEPARSVPDVSLPEGIEQDENGTYYWTYAQSMWQHTEVLGTILLIFGIIFGFMFLLVALVSRENIGTTLLAFLGIYAFMALVSVISWAIVNLLHHGQQHLLFTMSEEKITYGVLPESAKVTQRIGAAGLVVGALSSNLTMMGTSLAATSQSFSSEYRTVKKIKSVPRHDLIRVHSVLTKNTIYCAPAQYEFVWDYLVAHCPKAKIIGKNGGK